MLDPRGRSRVSREEVEGQSDPFYAECRAYGSIASKHRKKPIAVTCHGFISIPAGQEDYFAGHFDITDWNRPKQEAALKLTKRQPFRALVKQLVEHDVEVTEKLVLQMRKGIRALNSLRVYVMDVKWNNYKGGLLVDFSSAFTEPHFEFRKDINSQRVIDINRRIDMAAFEEMVKEELGMDLFKKRTLRPRK